MGPAGGGVTPAQRAACRVMDAQCVLFHQHSTKINKNKGEGRGGIKLQAHGAPRHGLSGYKPHIRTNALNTHIQKGDEDIN